ncbi:MAG: helix-turn-helix domain-containing protein [Proteobacteria bacterium]|nr:helix-turn-helix domain-containing protein [Pseudomonadota bacterium]
MENQSYGNSVAKKLKRICEFFCLSKTEIAKSLGVSPGTYKEWELGERLPKDLPGEIAMLFYVDL